MAGEPWARSLIFAGKPAKGLPIGSRQAKHLRKRCLPCMAKTPITGHCNLMTAFREPTQTAKRRAKRPADKSAPKRSERQNSRYAVNSMDLASHPSEPSGHLYSHWMGLLPPFICGLFRALGRCAQKQHKLGVGFLKRSFEATD